MLSLKQGPFHEWHRPPTVFGRDAIHYITVQGEEFNTFPSGHGMAAALMGLFWAIGLWRLAGHRTAFQGVAVLLAATVALLVGYSRIYIGVHFLGDVLAGSLLGVSVGLAGHSLFTARWDKWFAQRTATTHRILDGIFYLVAAFLLVQDLTRLSQYYTM